MDSMRCATSLSMVYFENNSFMRVQRVVLDHPLLFIFIITSCLFALITPLGTNLRGDAAAYLSAAENILRKGPMLSYDGSIFIHWTPLPALLSAPVHFFSLNPFVWSGIINGLLIGIAGVLSYLIFRALHIEVGLSLLSACGIILMQPIIIIGGALIQSDLIFLICTAATYYFYSKWMQTDERKFFLFLIIAAALACVARYSGLFLVAAVSIHYICNTRWPISKRFVYTVLYAGLSLVPFVLYLLRNMLITGSLTDRTYAVNAVSYNVGIQIVESLGKGLFGFWGDISVIMRVLLITAVGIPIVWCMIMMKKKEASFPNTSRRLFTLMWLFMIFYLIFLILTFLFIDAKTRMDNVRLFAPITYTLYIVFILSMYTVWNRVREKLHKRIILYLGLAAIFFYVTAGLITASELRSSMFAASGLNYFFDIDRIRSSPRLYSNTPDLLYVSTGRRATFPAEPVDRMHQLPNVRFSDQMRLLKQDLMKGGVTIILRGYRASDDMVLRELLNSGFKVLDTFNAVVIVGYEKN